MASGRPSLLTATAAATPCKPVIAPTACNACRTNHQKCNRGHPCSRCVYNGRECFYSKSRRGAQGPHRRPLHRLGDGLVGMNRVGSSSNVLPRPTDPKVTAETGPSASFFLDPTFQSVDITWETWMADYPSISVDDASHALTLPPQPPSLIVSPLEWEFGKVLTSYYCYCHPSHPFLPHRLLLERILCENSLPYLESAIRYTTAAFTPRHTAHRYVSDDIIGEVLATFNDEKYNTSHAPFMLQALLLLTLSSGTQCHTERASLLMTTLREFALRLGLNRAEFAVLHGEGNPLLEDSWRRTWWEAHIIDAMRYGMHVWEAPLGQVETDVLVPLGSWEGKGTIATPISLVGLDGFLTCNPTSRVASYAYRTEAARLFTRMLSIYQKGLRDSDAAKVLDAAVMNRILTVPWDDMLVTQDLKVDEMMAQAKMLLSTTIIILHSRIFFGLNTLSHVTDINSADPDSNDLCTKVVRSDTSSTSNKYPNAAIHRTYRLTGAKEILTALCIPNSQSQPHTPFTSCFAGLAFAVFFTELLYSSGTTGGREGIGNGDHQRRDLRDQMGYCLSIMRRQAQVFPVAILGVDKATELIKGSSEFSDNSVDGTS